MTTEERLRQIVRENHDDNIVYPYMASLNSAQDAYNLAIDDAIDKLTDYEGNEFYVQLLKDLKI